MSMEKDGLAVRIRRMEHEDLERVLEIDRLSFSQPWPSRSFQFELDNNPAAEMWVAETITESGQTDLVGMMVIWLVVDEAHIGTIAVHPDYRHQGIGSRLLRHGLINVQKEGAVMVYLEVRRSNTDAQELYHHYGFTFTGVRKNYYQDNGEDALILTLDNLQTRDFS
jgi:[ribosomal protein S18]-alanine N-acetyltransferase